MTDPDELGEDGADATGDMADLVEQLRATRPLPSPAFTRRVRRTFETRSLPDIQPARARLLVGRYAAAGTVLMILGALSAAGAGPLGG